MKKVKSAPRSLFIPSAGEYYKENNGNRRAKLLTRLNIKIWQARNLDTGAKIKIANKDLRDREYHEGWTRISAQDVLGPNWGKIQVSNKMEEMFGALNLAASQ